MDLTSLLEKNKSRIKNTEPTGTRKAVYIAEEDRPYSPPPPLASELVTNKEPIGNQLVTGISNQLVTNKEPISNQPKNLGEQEKNNKEPISNRISNRNKGPISNPLVTGLVTALEAQDLVSKTSGLQRKILFYIVKDCIYRGKLESGYITNQTLRDITNTNANTVKTAVQRLINKKLLKRKEGQRGQGGFSCFHISDAIRDAVLKEERNPSISNQLVTGLVTAFSNQLVTNKGPDKGPNAPSSSSILNIKETTTTQLSEEWNFDIGPYAKFGFTMSQLKQLALLGVSASDVEQSLIEFNYDLANNTLPIIKTGKINFLMGLLRSGHSYVSETYRNDQESIILEMANRAEQRRKKLLEEKFIAWEATLSEDQRRKVLAKIPTSLMVLEKTYGLNDAAVKKWYFEYFQNIKKEPM